MGISKLKILTHLFASLILCTTETLMIRLFLGGAKNYAGSNLTRNIQFYRYCSICLVLANIPLIVIVFSILLNSDRIEKLNSDIQMNQSIYSY